MHQCSRNAHLLTEGLTILLWWTPHTGILLLGTLDMYFFSSNILGKKNYCIFTVYDQQTPSPTQSPETISRDHGSYSLRWEILHKCRGARWKKNVWEFTHGATDESLMAMNHQIHTAGDLNVKNPLFSVVQKYNGMYATNNAWITNISPLYCFFHFSLKFSVSFFF